jgi:hypothetical protein
MQELDILILGAGWTSTFLIPLLEAKNLSFAATTRDGRKVAGANTIRWAFNPDEDSADTEQNQFSALPLARHVLISFPLTGHGQSETLVRGYEKIYSKKLDEIRFIQLGSTGIWQIPQKTIWVSRRSPYDTSNKRAVAEDELLKLGGCVLNLAGLWGGERQPSNWVDRVAKNKEDVKNKKSLHLIHGQDVARAIVAVMGYWYSGKSQRWMLTDGFVYDWWSLIAGWADSKNGSDSSADREPLEQAKWVHELMQEQKIWALPRSKEELGRCYYGREFWDTFQMTPLKARV